MKKVLMLLISCIFVMLCASCCADELSVFGDYVCEVWGDVVYIVDYTGFEEKILLPSQFESMELRGISEGAFQDCNHLREIVLPEGLRTIGAYAFQNCENLRNITFPLSLRAIDEGAFVGCTNLKEFVFLSGETEIAEQAFDEWNITRVYCMPHSSASEYAMRKNIPYTLFLRGSWWENRKNKESLYFREDDLGEIHNPIPGIDEFVYSAFEDPLIFRLYEGIRANGRINGRVNVNINGNELKPVGGGTYVCYATDASWIEFQNDPLWEEKNKLANSRWQYRNDDEETVIQFIDDHTIEIVDRNNSIINTINASISETSASWTTAWDTSTIQNSCYVTGSTLIGVQDGEIRWFADYIGIAEKGVKPTYTPVPTPEPTPTPSPESVKLTSEVLLGEWVGKLNNIVFYEDGRAEYGYISGEWRIVEDIVLIDYYDPSMGMRASESFSWNEKEAVLYKGRSEWIKEEE